LLYYVCDCIANQLRLQQAGPALFASLARLPATTADRRLQRTAATAGPQERRCRV
jgi:hypothetical protein